MQKAYDSVPFNSIINSLRRIKIPDTFIRQVQKIISRTVFIESPAGKTNLIKAERGLPQGDPISPILWNIFLMKLQSKVGYKFSENLCNCICR